MSAVDRPLAGAPARPKRPHVRLYCAELAATALLVSIGLSVVIVFFGAQSPLVLRLPSPALRRFIAGALFGTVGALITVSPLGRVSGAHLNPAVTFAFWLEDKLAWRDAVGYALGQFVGAAVGAWPLLAWGAMGASVRYGATSVGAPGHGLGRTRR